MFHSTVFQQYLYFNFNLYFTSDRNNSVTPYYRSSDKMVLAKIFPISEMRFPSHFRAADFKNLICICMTRFSVAFLFLYQTARYLILKSQGIFVEQATHCSATVFLLLQNFPPFFKMCRSCNILIYIKKIRWFYTQKLA